MSRKAWIVAAALFAVLLGGCGTSGGGYSGSGSSSGSGGGHSH